METRAALTVSAAGILLWATGLGRTIDIPTEYAYAIIAVVILGQGFVRDIFEIMRRRKLKQACHCGVTAFIPGVGQASTTTPPPPAVWEINLCMESATGVLLLALACGNIAFEIPKRIVMPGGLGLLILGLILLVGSRVRDWVLTLRHVPDHYSMPVIHKPGPTTAPAPENCDLGKA
jgi:hypothetical protein